MYKTPHAVLFHAALSYAATAAAQGDDRLCKAIGFRRDQLARLREMSARAIMKMAAKGIGCVQVEVDPDAFDDLARDVDQEIKQERLIEAFIQHDASREMMADLFGMTARDFAQARRSMDGNQPTGRTRSLTVEEQEAIYTAWEARNWQKEPADYLAIARELDIPLREIWEDEQEQSPLGAIPSHHRFG